MKKTILFPGIFLFLISILAICPVVLGYGSSYATATGVEAGVYNETLYS